MPIATRLANLRKLALAVTVKATAAWTLARAGVVVVPLEAVAAAA